MIYGDQMIFGGNANYPFGFFNLKKRIFLPKEDPSKKYFLIYKVNANSI